MKRKELEILLERIEDIPEPDVASEQYATPAPVAADLLFFAFANGDIEDRVVYDLGCGNGILGIGAKVLGARAVIGIDRDARAIEVARRNTAKFGMAVEFRRSAVQEVSGKGDTVVMNPPFGAQWKNRHADRVFLAKALELAPVVYAILNVRSESFVEALVPAATILRYPVSFPMKRRFWFHEKDRKMIPVEIYRIAKEDQSCLDS